MSLGNKKTYGNKGEQHSFEHRQLLLQQEIITAVQNLIIGAPPGTGLAQEVTLQSTNSTLISVLNAIVASDQDIEVLLVRDEAVGNGNPVVKQVTNYQTGVPVITYENVDGSTYVPSPNPPVYVYLDPSSVLNLILAQNTSINNKLVMDDDDNGIAEGQTLPLSIVELYGAWDGAWQRISTDGNNNMSVSVDNSALPTGASTETTLSALNTKFVSVTRTPTLERISGIASASVAAGARSVSFFNSGPTDATVAGGVLKSGEQVTFSAGAEDDVLGAIAYVTIATGDLMITKIV